MNMTETNNKIIKGFEIIVVTDSFDLNSFFIVKLGSTCFYNKLSISKMFPFFINFVFEIYVTLCKVSYNQLLIKIKTLILILRRFFIN